MRLTERRFASIAGCMVLLGVTPLLVAATSGGTASKRVALPCGATVTTSVTLTADITGCTSAGLLVGANGITINLNGHTISGTVDEGVGVADTGHTGVTIENGSISTFELGVGFLNGANDGRAQNLHVAVYGQGVKIEQADHVVVTGSFVSGGVVGLQFAGTGNQAVGNWVESSSTGIDAAGAGLFISQNRVLNSGLDGIDIGPGATGQLTGNITNGSGGDGIHQSSGTPSMTLKSNRASFNGAYGINSAPLAVDGGGNVVQDNTNSQQCKNVVCAEVSS